MACKSQSEIKSIDKSEVVSNKSDIKKIDIHSHFRYTRGYLPAFFEKWNMRSLLVDVSIADSTGTSRSWDNYVDHTRSHPDMFFLCSSFIATGIDDPNFASNTINQLSKEIESGARMVKVWKNFGMVTKDNSGHYIQIDDERLQPIWDFLKTKKIPIIAHIGEPEQAWRWLDPNNPHYSYYKNNPQYHAYKMPEIPSYETIIDARDNWLEKNPDLQILCAHLGSMSHDVDMVAERLDKFPNMSIELGARFGDLVKQDSKKVRLFFEKYQNRILFGSDYGNYGPEASKTDNELKQEENDLDASYDRLWRYLSSTETMEIRGQRNVGLGLGTDVLRKVYFENATKFLKIEE